MQESLEVNYRKICNKVQEVCKKLGRNFAEIKIIAVSKTFPSSDILTLFNLGHTDFGENKVQELIGKKIQLEGQINRGNINWHLVGHLQSNKVKYIIDFIHLIHSVDNLKLALEIQKLAQKKQKIANILIQVNTSNESQKYGIEISKAKSLFNEISRFENISVRGLMTIAEYTDNIATIRKNFSTLKNLFEEIKSTHNSLQYLSMGMTSDFEIALEEGANMLRIGSAIFGNRNYNK